MYILFFLIVLIILWIISGFIVGLYHVIFTKPKAKKLGCDEFNNSIANEICFLRGFLWFIPDKTFTKILEEAWEQNKKNQSSKTS